MTISQEKRHYQGCIAYMKQKHKTNKGRTGDDSKSTEGTGEESRRQNYIFCNRMIGWLEYIEFFFGASPILNGLSTILGTNKVLSASWFSKLGQKMRNTWRIKALFL